MTDRPQQMTAYPQLPAEPPTPAGDASATRYLHAFMEFFASRKSEPAAVAALRQEAIARFGELGFPTTKNEDWHFTSVSSIAARDFERAPADSSTLVSSDDLAAFRFGQEDWPTAVFVDGRFASGLSSGGSGGAQVGSLREAIQSGDEGVLRLLGKITDHQNAAFTALNTAFFEDGCVVRIGSGVTLEQPVHLVFVSTGRDTISHPRNLIIVGRGARGAVIESYLSAGTGSSLTNAVTEILIEDGARLDHVKVQREAPGAFHVGTSDTRQGRDSTYHSFSYATGAELSRSNVYTVLAGEGGHATLNGLYMVDGSQHVDHQTRIEHAAPNCTSHEIYKGVLDDRSHGVFNGKVYVHPEAQKTDGKQSNNNLLLSPDARVDTKPQLEIFADDVKCTHGATVGRLDANALFYFRSRGIPESRARTLLTYAFAAEVIEEIDIEAVRDELERLVLARVTKGSEEAIES